MANFVLTVFKKVVESTKVDDKGKASVSKFPTYFGKVNKMKGSINVRLSNAVVKMLDDDRQEFPLDFELGKNDYFLTTEEYENEQGILLEKTVCVIQNFQSVKPAEIEKATLEDYFKGLQDVE